MIYPSNFEQKIGFDSIRHILKGKCLSTLGQERVDEMAFSESYDEINRRLEEVTEFIRIIQEEDEFPDQYFFDVRPSLKRIRIDGMYLEEQELFDLRRSLETIRDIVRFLQRNTSDSEDPLFGGMNLFASAGGLPVWANLMLAVADEVETSMRGELKKREARIKKYTEKYQSKV